MRAARHVAWQLVDVAGHGMSSVQTVGFRFRYVWTVAHGATFLNIEVGGDKNLESKTARLLVSCSKRHL